MPRESTARNLAAVNGDSTRTQASGLEVGSSVVLEGLFAAPLASRILAGTPRCWVIAPPRVAGHEIPLPRNHGFRIVNAADGIADPQDFVTVTEPTPDVPGYMVQPMIVDRSGSERRRAPRFSAALDVWVTPRCADRPRQEVGGITVDISQGGALIALPEGFESDQAVDIRINLGALGMVSATASAARCSAADDGWSLIGVRFVNVALADRRRFGMFLRRCRKGTTESRDAASSGFVSCPRSLRRSSVMRDAVFPR